MSDSLLALALLKVNWDINHSSYIDNFNILTLESIRRSQLPVVSAIDTKDRLRQYFGLDIPTSAVTRLLKRAAKQGYLEIADGVYQVNRTRLQELDFRSRHTLALKAYELVIDNLWEYSNEHFPTLRWLRNDAEKAIELFFAENSLSLLRATVHSTPMTVPTQTAKNSKYVLAKYVNATLLSGNLEIIKSLQTVAEGNLLITGIFLPNLSSSSSRKFLKTTLYFDTTYLLDALGYHGSSLKSPAVELLTLSTNLGAKLACFTHTQDEIRSILRACARSLSPNATRLGQGSVYRHFIEHRASSSDVLFLESRLTDNLKHLGLVVNEKPRYDKDYQIDEKDLQNSIANEIKYSNTYALHRDVDSISAIIRLRGDKAPRFLESCDYLFVTSNSGLVRAVKAFQNDEEELGEVALCMSHQELFNLVWLKSPLKAPDLPRRRLIADFYAALQPSDKFRTRYLEEIARLEREGAYNTDDVYLLRHSIEAENLAMDLTLGDEAAFAEGTIAEVMEVMRERIKEGEKAKAEAAQEATRQANEMASSQARRVVRLEEKQARLVATQRERSARIAQVISKVIVGILSLILVLVMFFIPDKYTRLTTIGQLIVILVTVWGLFKPTPLLHTFNTMLEVRLAPQVERLFRWMSGS